MLRRGSAVVRCGRSGLNQDSPIDLPIEAKIANSGPSIKRFSPRAASVRTAVRNSATGAAVKAQLAELKPRFD